LSNSPFVDSGGLADHSNSSIYQAASGAWVFSAGTIAWSWGLDDFDHTFADVRLQRSTSNILDAFLSVGAPLPPPVLQISAVQVTNVASTSALVTWQTNNAANSRVDYGTTTSYGSVVTDAASVTGHSLTLPGLIPSTTYHYAVTSLDAFTQSAVSTDATFTTTGSAPNMISNPGFESGAAGWGLAASASIDTVPSDAHSGSGSLKLAATATWQGNWQSFAVTPGNTYTFGGWERSTTSGGYLSVFSYNASWVQLDQGTHLVYPGTGAWTSRSGTYVAPPGTAYALIGTQNSATGTFWFDDLTFSGGPPPALQISGVQATSNGTTSATVTWQTNNASNSRVDYGTTTGYGSAVTNASSASAHTISLSGLTPNTTYHYKVTSVDSFTQTTSSADATFTTTAPPLLQISAVQATGIGTTSATITWQTNNASNSRVDSGTTTAYGNVVTNATAVSAHTLNLAGLSSNTTYHYMVTSVDAYTQAASSTDATFTTSSVPPLLISAVQATSVGTASAVIGWQTTNASNSRVDYGTTTAYGGFLTNASSVSAHTMSLSGLTPNTTYHYRVTSVDAYTQSASSLDAIFVTTAASTNLVANPGFEGGTASWQLASSASVNTVAANAHSGTRSLRLVATAPWQGNWQSFAVTAGGTYTFSAWERSTTAGGYLSVFSYDANWVQIDQGTHVIYPVSSTWSSRTGTYVAPPGTAFALIGVHNSAAGTFWFDDISMTSP
jgi:phosphodiesterase/alkaline phosphatase D-like protein